MSVEQPVPLPVTSVLLWLLSLLGKRTARTFTRAWLVLPLLFLVPLIARAQDPNITDVQTQPAVELQLDEIVVRDTVEHRRLVPFAGEADLDAVLNGEQVFREVRALEVRPAAFIRLALTVNADLLQGRPR